MQEMKNYKITATILTPTHIGSGNSFSMTDFVIWNRKLYLAGIEEYIDSKEERDAEALIFFQNIKRGNTKEIQRFMHKKAKEISALTNNYIEVANGIYEEYEKYHKNINTRDINQWEIKRNTTNPISLEPYIPGSSLKGSIKTAIIEKFKTKEEADKNLTISLSDLKLTNDIKTKIYFTHRIKKLHVNTAPSSSIPSKHEYMEPGGIYEGTIQLPAKKQSSLSLSPLNMLIDNCNKFYFDILYDILMGANNSNLDKRKNFVTQTISNLEYMDTDELKKNNSFIINLGFGGGKTLKQAPKPKEKIPAKDKEEPKTANYAGDNAKAENCTILSDLGWVCCQLHEME